MTSVAAAMEVRDLGVAIHGVPVVTGVDLVMPRGRTLALVGESGCGKSITALALINLLPEGGRRVSGALRLGADDLTGSSEARWRRVRGRRIGMIFQDPSASLDPLMTVGRQIREALLARGGSSRSARAEARALLDQVGIPDSDRRLDQYPFELSGGMAQRVMIAIALAARPELLIADEPTTALDVTIQAQILHLLAKLQSETGAGILLITHDIGVVAETAHEVAVMYAGTVVERGPTELVLAAPSHPYTRLLLQSIPTLEAQRGERLAVIDGAVAEPGAWPPGCRFAPRCPHARARCAEGMPVPTEVGPGRAAACVRLREIEA